MSIADKYTTLTTEKIPKVYEAGYEKGKAEGGDTTAAYEKGVEDGKQSEYDAFWDAYQDKGNYKMSHYMFAGNGWNDKTFKPKYDIKFRYGCTYTFGLSLMTDIVASLQAQEVTLNTKEASNLAYLCYSMMSRSFPVLDTTGVTGYTYGSMRGIFYDARQLEYINKIITNETIFYNDWFYRCEKLRDVTFEGVIGNNIDFQYSTLLSKASIKNIIGCLSDTASGKTLTLSKTAVENAFADGVIQITPFNESPSSIFTNNGDGSISVKETPMEDTSYVIKSNLVLQKGVYSLSLGANHFDFTYNDIILSVKKNGEVIASAKYGTPVIPVVFEITEDDALVDLELTVFNTLSSDGSVTVTPSLSYAQDWESLIATKPNWTISLV